MIEEPISEVVARSQPLTVITPIKVGMSFVNWSFLKLMSFVSKLKLARELEFIHFARWQRVRTKDLPRLVESQPKEDLRRDFFFFASNFNGPWDQYIDTFALVPKVRNGMWWLWRFSKGFPGPFPIRNFKNYIQYHTYMVQLYYDAYEEATVRGINAALGLAEQFKSFQKQTPNGETEDAFRARYLTFVGDISEYLSSSSVERALPLKYLMSSSKSRRR
jgi:hypothetical protein